MQLFQYKYGSIKRHEGRSASLQNRVHQFNSGRDLHSILLILIGNGFLGLFAGNGPATALLPLPLAPLVTGCRQRPINHRGSVFLHPGNDMAVKVQGNADPTVAEPLAGDLRVNAVR
jgi:hypothetical protein